MTPEEALGVIQTHLTDADDEDEVRFWMYLASCVDARRILETERQEFREQFRAKAEASLEAEIRRKSQATLESKVIPGLKKLVADLRIDHWDLTNDDY